VVWHVCRWNPGAAQSRELLDLLADSGFTIAVAYYRPDRPSKLAVDPYPRPRFQELLNSHDIHEIFATLQPLPLSR
jgi:hypothetical protein